MTPAELRTLMTVKRLTAPQVAGMVYVTERAVFYWLAGERPMPDAAAELLELKAAALPDPPTA